MGRANIDHTNHTHTIDRYKHKRHTEAVHRLLHFELRIVRHPQDSHEAPPANVGKFAEDPCLPIALSSIMTPYLLVEWEKLLQNAATHETSIHPPTIVDCGHPWRSPTLKTTRAIPPATPLEQATGATPCLGVSSGKSSQIMNCGKIHHAMNLRSFLITSFQLGHAVRNRKL